MSARASDSPSGPNAGANLDGEMSIIRTVKRAFGTLESSLEKQSEVSNEEISNGNGDLQSHISQNESEPQTRRQIDLVQELYERSQPDSHEIDVVDVVDEQHSNPPLQNDSRHFSIDYSGANDQELSLENIVAMDGLREDVILYRTGKPSSDLYKIKFGDWSCFKDLLQKAAASFNTERSEAKRLRELSLCSDSKAEEILNKYNVSQLIKKGVDIIQKEFFPELPAVENEEYWTARKKRKKDPATEQDSEFVDDYVPNPRMRSLIQSVESNVPTIIELRNKEWFTVRDLRALFDSIINSNSSIFKFDAEV
jgi:hypothetical protein